MNAGNCVTDVTSGLKPRPTSTERVIINRLCAQGRESGDILDIIWAARNGKNLDTSLEALRAQLGELVDKYLALIIELLKRKIPIDEIVSIIQAADEAAPPPPPGATSPPKYR